MAHKTVPLVLPDGRTFNLRFGAIGAFLLQQTTEMGVVEFSRRIETMSIGLLELHALLFAELESARRADHVHPVAWTLDSVGELIDSCYEGDLGEFWRIHTTAVIAAFNTSFTLSMRRHEDLERRQAEARAVPNPPTAAVSTGDTPAPGVSGMTSSTMPQTSE